jgi:hypothetical protein
MASDNDLLALSGEYGKSFGGHLGKKGCQEAELAFVTRLFPPRFSNILTLRTVLLILLCWLIGFLKSTILKEFCQVIPDCFRVVHLSSATTEILCGSISTPKNPFQLPRIVLPAFAGADFVVVPEYSALLKHGGPVEAKISILNEAMEGDLITTKLVKLGQVQIDPTQKLELEKLGVKYEPSEATLSYRPNFVMLAASHPFPKNTLGPMIDLGHLDRFHIVQYKITREIAAEYLHENHVLDMSLQQQLKAQNTIISKTKITSIAAAPNQLLKPIYSKLLALTEIPDLRIKGDILRTAAAHMVLRHFADGNLKEVYTEQDYSIAEVDFISERLNEFVEPRIRPLVADGYSEIETERVGYRVRTHIDAFLTASKSEGKMGEPLKAIVDDVQSKISVHYQTVRNNLQELVRQGKVEKVPEKFGYYRLTEKELGDLSQ